MSDDNQKTTIEKQACSGSDGAILLSFSRKLFEFDSKTQWINKAQFLFETCGVPKHRYIAIDTAGRVCASGKEFMRAEDEGTYPISVYEI